MDDYFYTRKRDHTSLTRELLSTHDYDQDLEFEHKSTETLYKSALALGTGFLSDINLIVHEDVNNNDAEPKRRTFKCHKLILSMHSPVFHTMFHGSLPEREDVHIVDTNASAFQLFLQFIYAGLFPTNLSAHDTSDLLYLTHKYEVKTLESSLVARLKETIAPVNALSVLKIAELCNLNVLIDAAWAIVDWETEEVIQGEEWLHIDEKILRSVLERKTLQVDECLLFKRTLGWAAAEAERTGRASNDKVTIREILGSNLHLFTFPRMDASTFANGPAISGILSDSEIVVVFLYTCGTILPKPSPHPFPTWCRGVIPTSVKPVTASGTVKAVGICDCRQNRHCTFCFLLVPFRKLVKSSNQTVNDKRALFETCAQDYNRGRGQPESDPSYRKKLATATPAAYCPCRTRNSCPLGASP